MTGSRVLSWLGAASKGSNLQEASAAASLLKLQEFDFLIFSAAGQHLILRSSWDTYSPPAGPGSAHIPPAELPDDVLAILAEMRPGEMRGLSRLFRHLSGPHVVTLGHYVPVGPPLNSNSLAEKFPNLRHLSLDSTFSDDDLWALEGTPLISLHVPSGCQLRGKPLLEALKAMPLESLRVGRLAQQFDSTDLYSLLLEVPSLRVLDLEDCSGVGAAMFDILANTVDTPLAATPLVSLRMHGCISLEAPLLALRNTPTLTALDLSRVEGLTDAGLRCLLGKPLISLKLSAFSRVGPVPGIGVVPGIGPHQPNAISADALRDLVSALSPTLTELCLCGVGMQLGNGHMGALRGFSVTTRLALLDLSHAIGGVTDVGLCALGGLTSLTSLTLAGGSAAPRTDASLSALQNLTQLRALDLSHWGGITAAGLWLVLDAKLTSLSLRYCGGLSYESGLPALERGFPWVAVLDIGFWGGGRISKAGYEALKRLPLQSLDVSSSRVGGELRLEIAPYGPARVSGMGLFGAVGAAASSVREAVERAEAAAAAVAGRGSRRARLWGAVRDRLGLGTLGGSELAVTLAGISLVGALALFLP